MPFRVSPTDKIRAEIDALFGSGRDLAEVIEDVARLLIQTAVEAEVEDSAGPARRFGAGTATSAVPGSRTRRRGRATGSAQPR